MANTTRNIWNDDDGERVAPKKVNWLKHFLLLFLTLVVVLAAVVFAAYRDGTGFDVLRRYFNYGKSEALGSDALYDYDASANNRFALLGDQLVVLSDTQLRVLAPDGSEIWSVVVNMSAPALSYGGDRAVAYDVGGTELYVVNGEGLLMKLTADPAEPIVSATLNTGGWMAVTAEKKGYKSCVSVYDAEMKLAFAFNSSRRFVSDAYVTDDNAFVAAVTLGQEESVFVSNVVIYDLNRTDPQANYNVEDGLVLAIDQQEELLATVSDNCLTFADRYGNIRGTYGYSDKYLRDYDLGGEGFSVLLLNRYRSGSVGRLVSVAPDGTELGALDVNEEVLGISAAGRYLAVLYAEKLVIYNQNLRTYATLKGTDFAREVRMRPDGSALLLSSEYARLFLP